jgi:hypothetical protein
MKPHLKWIRAKDTLWAATEEIFDRVASGCKYQIPPGPTTKFQLEQCNWSNTNRHVCAIEICPLLSKGR